MINEYYQLTKPGIVYGNVLTGVAAFLYASHRGINWGLGAAMLVGLALIIASAAATNNYLDRDIDANMERTKKRALVAGRISPTAALWFAALLLGAGSLLLFFYTNLLTLSVALAAWVVYVALYTPLKRVSAHALFVGAVAGALPPVVGYVAVTNTLDQTALLLFAFLFVWQLPHFLAIAVYRYDEYKNAGVPLYITKEPSERAKKIARKIFHLTLVVLLVWCAALILQR